MRSKSWLLLFLLSLLLACQQTPPVQKVEHLEILVEKILTTGMSQAEIIETIGAPKIIQKSARGAESGVENWLFDVRAKSVQRRLENNKQVLWLNIDIDPTMDRTHTTVEVRFDPDGLAQSFSYQEKRF